ncbi:MAG: hypothetical protein H0U57_03445 [Tatlockia sp.]|nr:hypothetical protein [Tatlockia sp.]
MKTRKDRSAVEGKLADLQFERMLRENLYNMASIVFGGFSQVGWGRTVSLHRGSLFAMRNENRELHDKIITSDPIYVQLLKLFFNNWSDPDYKIAKKLETNDLGVLACLRLELDNSNKLPSVSHLKPDNFITEEAIKAAQGEVDKQQQLIASIKKNSESKYNELLDRIFEMLSNHNYDLNFGGVTLGSKKFSKSAAEVYKIIIAEKEYLQKLDPINFCARIKAELSPKKNATKGLFFKFGDREETTAKLYRKILKEIAQYENPPNAVNFDLTRLQAKTMTAQEFIKNCHPNDPNWIKYMSEIANPIVMGCLNAHKIDKGNFTAPITPEEATVVLNNLTFDDFLIETSKKNDNTSRFGFKREFIDDTGNYEKFAQGKQRKSVKIGQDTYNKENVALLSAVRTDAGFKFQKHFLDTVIANRTLDSNFTI